MLPVLVAICGSTSTTSSTAVIVARAAASIGRGQSDARIHPEDPAVTYVDGRQSRPALMIRTPPVPNWFSSYTAFFVGVGLTA